MRAFLSLFVLTLIANPLGIEAQGIGPLAKELQTTRDYLRDAKFEVLLPSAQDPVTYDITLQSDSQPADSLSPCEYLIRWNAKSPNGLISGFSAYFDGNHYRYRNNRLQEYHYDTSPASFGTAGANKSDGVHRQAQFADLLPQFIGEKLLLMEADTSYSYTVHPDTLVQGRRSIAIDGVKRNNGYDSQNYLYAFDYDTHLPSYFDIETSPGTISEQLITVTFSPNASLEKIELSENSLINHWPAEFENYRESNFRAENLAGNPMPDFSCQIFGTDNRLSHRYGDKFDAPVIIAVINPEVASAKETVDAVREAAGQLPFSPQVIFAFTSNHAEDIKDIAGESAADEIILSSAGSLIRNCGITLYPTLLMANSDGTVQKVHTGYNHDLPLIVIQEASLLK